MGYQIAQGKTLDEVTGSSGAVAEGVKTSISIHNLATKLGVEMPICEEVYQALHHNKPFIQCLHDLKMRPLQAELEGFEHDLTAYVATALGPNHPATKAAAGAAASASAKSGGVKGKL